MHIGVVQNLLSLTQKEEPTRNFASATDYLKLEKLI